MFQKRKFVLFVRKHLGKPVTKENCEAITLKSAIHRFRRENPNSYLVRAERFGRGLNTPDMITLR